MTYSTYPNRFRDGVSIGEVPLAITPTGKVFYVNNSSVRLNNAVAGENSPYSPNATAGTFLRPFSTIDYAIGQCVANRGDVIVVMENHVEDISAAAGIDLDVDGVTIIGMGTGDTQAKVTFSNAASTFEVNADNVTIDGLWFEATVTGVLIGVNVLDGADDYAIVNCRFSAETLGTDEFIDAISVTTSDRGVIKGNYMVMDEAGAASAIHLVGACLGCEIEDNTIQGDYSVACIESITAAQEMVIIDGNTLVNGAHSGLNTVAVVSLLTGTTGVIQNNQCYTAVAGAATGAIVADACWFGGNNWVQSAAETAPLPIEGGASSVVRSVVATGKADETDGLALFTVTGEIYVHGIMQRAEVAADSAVSLGIQVDATDTTRDATLIQDTALTTETSVGDYAVCTTAGGSYTVVQVETTTTAMTWNTPVVVPAGSIEQAASGTPGALVSGYILLWSEATAGATCVAA